MTRILLNLYKFVLTLAAPAVPLLLAQRLHKGLEEEGRTGERHAVPSRPRPSGKLIWIHAASVGETLSVTPLIERMPERNFLVTTTTWGAAKVLAGRDYHNVIHQYVPFDVPKWVRTFLDYWRPDAGIIVESELWPNLLSEVRGRAIPLTLLNGRLSPKSLRRWGKIPSVLRQVMGCFDKVYMQSMMPAQCLRDMGVRGVQVMPNLKNAAEPLPVDTIMYESLRTGVIGGRQVWMAASTHSGEERIMIEAHRKLLQTVPDALLILAPRHPVRVPEITAICPEGTLLLSGLSQAIAAGTAAAAKVLIVDRLGVLGTFFSTQPVVVMGGSFTPIGGHNPLEPALFGCPVICGPHMFNFEPVLELFDKLLMRSDASGLSPSLSRFFSIPETAAAYGESLRQRAQDARVEAAAWLDGFTQDLEKSIGT